MDEKNTKAKIVKKSGNTTCACGDGCCCGCGSGRTLIWWIIGIIVLLVVFMVGVKLGEFRVELRDSMMYGRGYNYGPLMPVGGYNPGGLPSGVTGASSSASGSGSDIIQ